MLSLSRCLSPPESVVSGWPRLTYPRPTSTLRRRMAWGGARRQNTSPSRGGVGRAGSEELLRLGGGHGQHLSDVLAVQAVFEHLRLKPLAAAFLAYGRDGSHHRQVGVNAAGSVAVLARAG